jgi:hypothetical protein
VCLFFIYMLFKFLGWKWWNKEKAKA